MACHWEIRACPACPVEFPTGLEHSSGVAPADGAGVIYETCPQCLWVVLVKSPHVHAAQVPALRVGPVTMIITPSFVMHGRRACPQCLCMDLTKYHNRMPANLLLLRQRNYNAWQADLWIKIEISGRFAIWTFFHESSEKRHF